MFTPDYISDLYFVYGFIMRIFEMAIGYLSLLGVHKILTGNLFLQTQN